MVKHRQNGQAEEGPDQRHIISNNDPGKMLTRVSIVFISIRIPACKNRPMRAKGSYTSTFLLLVGRVNPRLMLTLRQIVDILNQNSE